jgi:DNA-binding NarL/FixJ family response regulator
MRYLLQEILTSVHLTEAGSRREITMLLKSQQFDLVLTSLFSVEGDWNSFLSELFQLSAPEKIIILSGIEEPHVIRQVLAAGAAGYLLKETTPEITIQAIRLVLAGGTYIPPTALGLVANPGAYPGSGDASADAALGSDRGILLTERQSAVLDLLIRGASNKEIAQVLELSPATVKSHVAALLRIHGASNRTELVSLAASRGDSARRAPTGSRRSRPGSGEQVP